MHPLAKLIRARPGAKSRFHTDRGELMPLTAFAEIPLLLTDRIRGRRPARPWMATPAVDELHRLIQRDWKVLEFGSGRSTGWYAARAGSVLSFEHEPSWRDSVETHLREAGQNNVELRLVSSTYFCREASALPDNAFDLVIVDCLDGGSPDTVGRVAIVKAAMDKVKFHGYLVLDNSDRARYSNADKHLTGWRCRRYVSLQVEPMMASETSIYSRPSDDESDGAMITPRQRE
jgi:hypothetical protein